MTGKTSALPYAPDLRSETLAGLREFFPLILPVATFAAMFGAASSAAGHTLAMTVWASVAIFAGASQFVFLEVYNLGVPAWLVMLAVFAVNFRHILYSAAATNKVRHFSFLQKAAAFFLLTDLQFAVVESRYSKFKGKVAISPAYYFAFGIAGYLTWVIMTFFGALSGALIKDPAIIGLDFVLPIYFLSILMGFRFRAHFYPVVLVSGVVAIFVERTLGAPWHISLGALAGIAAAVIATIIAPTPAPEMEDQAVARGQRDG